MHPHHTAGASALPRLAGKPGLCLIIALLVAAILGASVPTTASADTAPSARFRAIITGFHTTTATWDHWLQVDGKCDEVFLRTNISHFRRATLVDSGERTSDVMGDINGQPQGRILAGNCSDQGGIGSGTNFPTSTPSIGLPFVEGRNFPSMKVWEGDLVQGQDAVVIAPSIWEWDGGKSAFGDWTAFAKDTFAKVKDPIALVLPSAKPFLDWTEIGLTVAYALHESGVTGQASDRPIGTTRNPSTNQFEYVQKKVLALNYDNAREIANSSLIGLSPGTREFTFKDDGDLWGDYQLYLRVEKVHDNPPVEVPPTTTPPPPPPPTESEPEPEPDPEPLLCSRKPWLCE